MGIRGKGIPIEIRIKIARYFEEHGFDKDSKLAARKMYEVSHFRIFENLKCHILEFSKT